MSTTTQILTIRADKETQQKFKESWRNFNEEILGKMTQAEYLKHIIDKFEENKGK